MWKEFKAFAFKGNVLDLAVAVIIGGAFGKIVSSLVADILMPIIGILTGGTNFSEWTLEYKDAAITYGVFLQAVIDFFIIAASIFLFIKLVNRASRKKKIEEAPPAPPAPSKEELLLTEIRDLLKKQVK